MRRAAIPCGLVLALLCGRAMAGFELPLQLLEHNGAGGPRIVSNGVPLLPGQAMQTDELSVRGPDGKTVPAQFRVLARYWRGDRSIRWVLATFPADVPASGHAVYTLVGGGKVEPPAGGLKLAETADFVRVNTGAALFEISRKQFNLLSRVQIDADGDGRFADSETVVAPDPRLGLVATDARGRKYYSSQGPVQVSIIDHGPVMVRIMAKGTHVSTEDGAWKDGLYGYEVTMTFHAGTSYVNIDAIITNNPATPIGEPNMKDWSLVTRLTKAGAGGPRDVRFGGDKDQALAARPAAADVLYQDSLSGSNWDRYSGLEVHGKDPIKLQTFRGFKVFAVDGDTRREVAAGGLAGGWLDCSNGGARCIVLPKYFWQQFPKAIEYDPADGTVRYGMFPGEYSSVHWIEDGSAKGYELQLRFELHNRELAEDPGRVESLMATYMSNVVALPSPAFCGQAAALSDLGPYLVDERTPQVDWNMAKDAGSTGWQAFGCRWEEIAGHSPTNYEPKWTSGEFFNYLVTRKPNWLERGFRVSRQARDVRVYLIDDPELMSKWLKPGAFKKQSLNEMWVGKGSVGRKAPLLEPHPYRRTAWPLPNGEHTNLDEVYEYYLMTGDPRSLRCMEVIALEGLCLTIESPRIIVARSAGWCLRAMLRYYDLTGDPRFAPYVAQAIDKFWKDVDHAGIAAGNAWMLGIFDRAVILAWLITADERMRDLALGLSDWARTYMAGPQGYPYQLDPGDYWLIPFDKRPGGDWPSGYLIEPHAFAYDQTGDPQALAAMELADKCLSRDRRKFIGFLPTAMYWAYRPRPDKVAPSAVADLAAVAAGPGEVRLTWTAPGGDGDKGRAAVYQVKYAVKPILEFVKWPDQKDTFIAFWGARNVAGEPTPQPAGATESFTVKGLPAGKLYFAIKARDQQNNQSPISNVVEVDVPAGGQ